MQPKPDNTFCWFPFSLLALKEWDEKTGILNASPCCNSIRPESPDPLNIKEKLKNNPHNITANEIFYGEEMESIRHAMREGRRHNACNTCWKMEDRGSNQSYRLQSTPPGINDPEHDYKFQYLIKTPELKSIDFAFGENCNLRCRMCYPGLSNKLRIDYKYFVDNEIDTSGMQQFDYKKQWENRGGRTELLKHDINYKEGGSTRVVNFADNKQWHNILDNIHTLTHIKATGGETLMSKPFLEFLDTAIKKDVSRNIYLEFHTNATKFSNENINRLKQFKGLQLNTSIDSIGKNYEYIRYPMQWDIVDKSLKNLLTELQLIQSPMTPKMKYLKNFSFNVVLSSLNAHYLPELLKYKEELTKYNASEWSVFYVDLLWPEDKYINIKFLSKKVKKELIELYESMNSDTVAINIKNAIAFLKQWEDYEPTDLDRKNMLREITAFDKSRNQCYNDYLHPSIVEYLETPIK